MFFHRLSVVLLPPVPPVVPQELYKKSQRGGDEAAVPREPIEAQLEALATWHSSMAAHLGAFKSKFRWEGICCCL